MPQDHRFAGRACRRRSLALAVAGVFACAAPSLAIDTSRESAFARGGGIDLSATMWAKPADSTVSQIARQLSQADVLHPVDLSHKDLRFLDLSGLDFKRALISHADLFGVDLTRADLSGADLSNSRLDRAVIIHADFSGAKLVGATLLRPTVHSSFAYATTDAPTFAGANMKRLRVMARLDGASFRGADLTRADFSPHEPRPGQGTLSTVKGNELRSCDFSGATLVNANFDWAFLTFSSFVGANLRGAILSHADLSKVDFSGADLTGADLTGADLYNAVLVGVKGLDTVRGLETAVNLDKAKR
jgi:uncharacterized protein YjbI with pentapeptide repeats